MLVLRERRRGGMQEVRRKQVINEFRCVAKYLFDRLIAIIPHSFRFHAPLRHRRQSLADGVSKIASQYFSFEFCIMCVCCVAFDVVL